MEYFASLETGGTKCVCAFGSGPDDIHDITTFPTTTPKETVPKIIDFFSPRIHAHKIKKMGVSSFGPIDINKKSDTYGYITSTPKLPWQNFNLVGTLKAALGVEISFDTDVNGAALAEGKWGAAMGLDSYVYITCGTGIGVGIISNSLPVHGMLHPDGGHMILPLHPEDPSEGGFCPYHKNCWEGLASGPTFDKRWGMPAADIADGHLAWDIESYYLTIGIANIVCLFSPQRIILGGGISKRKSIFPRICTQLQQTLNGYIQTQELMETIDTYIVSPQLEHSGLLGGIIMAQEL